MAAAVSWVGPQVQWLCLAWPGPAQRISHVRCPRPRARGAARGLSCHPHCHGRACAHERAACAR
eukprot:2745068-Prorocentrum_lima.AAC.1